MNKLKVESTESVSKNEQHPPADGGSIFFAE